MSHEAQVCLSPTTPLLPHRQPPKEALPREVNRTPELEHGQRGVALREAVDRLRAQPENAGDLVRSEVIGQACLANILRRHALPLRKPHAARARSSAEFTRLTSCSNHHDDHTLALRSSKTLWFTCGLLVNCHRARIREDTCIRPLTAARTVCSSRARRAEDHRVERA